LLSFIKNLWDFTGKNGRKKGDFTEKNRRPGYKTNEMNGYHRDIIEISWILYHGYDIMDIKRS
jgi:hypothetical protein